MLLYLPSVILFHFLLIQFVYFLLWFLLHSYVPWLLRDIVHILSPCLISRHSRSWQQYNFISVPFPSPIPFTPFITNLFYLSFFRPLGPSIYSASAYLCSIRKFTPLVVNNGTKHWNCIVEFRICISFNSIIKGYTSYKKNWHRYSWEITLFFREFSRVYQIIKLFFIGMESYNFFHYFWVFEFMAKN